MMNPTDEELVMAYYQGDKEAFACLFQRYQAPIFNFSLRMLASRADAEDVVAETFLQLSAKRYRHRPGIKFVTWLMTVARNACLTHIRQRKKGLWSWWTSLKAQEMATDHTLAEKTSPREILDRRESSRKVRQAIERLPVPQREALILREYHGMSYAEISRILNVSLEQVKIRLFRAREHLRVSLKEVWDG